MENGFIDLLLKDFPKLDKPTLAPLISGNLISPFHIELKATVLSQAQKFVDNVYKMRESSAYIQKHSQEIKDPGNKSILMSYDFHLQNDQLKLIEINTNASFLVLGYWMYKFHKIAQPIKDFKIEELRENILEELRLQRKSIPKPKIAIVDDKPQNQRMFAEFLLYRELFNTWGFATEIRDFRDIDANFDFVYNRYTDFYLNHPESQNLKTLFTQQKICLSPNPFEYHLLADKTRLIEWAKDQKLGPTLPLCQEIKSENAEDLWSQRKKFFFKPLQAHGSKQSYRGESITRKNFEVMIDKGFIAQEFVPAPEQIFETDDGPKKFKFDLRFYAYKNRVQSVVARLYQGQLTNLQTKHGGYACVLFKA